MIVCLIALSFVYLFYFFKLVFLSVSELKTKNIKADAKLCLQNFFISDFNYGK